MQREVGGYSIFISCVAAIGGILFGYNTSVISGVLLFIQKEFHLSTIQQEVIVSTLLIGALLGALIGGFVADQIGRKKTLFLTLVLFFVGVITLTEADGFQTLLTGRFISGLAVGIVSMAAPLYIAEMAPAEHRGALVSLNQLCITIGILLAYIVSYSYSVSGDWRAMFGFAFFPIAIQFAGLFFIPESLSWKQGHNEAKADWHKLFSPAVRLPFLIGIGVAVFQSITGINTVIYYAPQIFQLVGYKAAETALFATVLVGAVNVAMTVVSLWLIDRIGRRPLLIGGLIGMALGR